MKVSLNILSVLVWTVYFYATRAMKARKVVRSNSLEDQRENEFTRIQSLMRAKHPTQSLKNWTIKRKMMRRKMMMMTTNPIIITDVGQ